MELGELQPAGGHEPRPGVLQAAAGKGFHLWDFEGIPGPGQWWARKEFYPKGTDPKLCAAGGRGISPLISSGFEVTLVPGGQCEVLPALAWWGLWGGDDAHSSVGQLGGHLSARGTALGGLERKLDSPLFLFSFECGIWLDLI